MPITTAVSTMIPMKISDGVLMPRLRFGRGACD
jgi:hypothetical protein